MLAGYESDDSDEPPAQTRDSDEPPAQACGGSSSSTAPSYVPDSNKTPKALPVPRKKVVNYDSLIRGVSKPLNFKASEDEYVPALPRSRPGLLSSLPPPKKAKTREVVIPPGLDIDLPKSPPKRESDEEEEEEEKEEAVATSFFNFAEDEAMPEEAIIPVSVLEPIAEEPAPVEKEEEEPKPKRPILPLCMMAGLTANERQELRDAENSNSITDVRGENLNDPQWFLKSAGKKTTVTGIITDVFESQADKVGESTGLQKRKHQINSLAQEYIQHGAEWMEKSAINKGDQGKTAKKYGW